MEQGGLRRRATKGPGHLWTGRSKPATVAKYWRNCLKLVAETAGIEGFHPHRLRDTFAVELLLAGLSMDDVSVLLGHRSVRTTERYYAPWNLARHGRLAALLREVHRQDPVLRAFKRKKPARAVTSDPRGQQHASSQGST